MSDILRDFDKKNEFPKVKLNLPKFDFSHLTEAVGNMNSVFENMTKDIRERQDNVMAMEFTKCIGELLKNNGVVPKMTEYTRNFEADNTFETRYGVSIDELDFSEHDKVFEDKIAKLEKELEEWKEEARVVKKQRDEQLKSFRKGIEPYVDLLHMHETIAELKQHIDELKSKNESLNQSINEITTSRSEWIDKTVEWQQKCEKLESKETEIVSGIDTSNSLACAKSLIEHMTHCEKFMIMPERDVQTFSVEELKEIADYLMVYYKHHKDRDAEDTISF